MDAQSQLRELVDTYLDSHLIEKIDIQAELLDVTDSTDEYKRYLPTGQLTITILLASR